MQISQLEKITDTRFSLNAYSFLEFVLSLEVYIKQGFSIEQSNEGLPNGFVGCYSCIMVKEKLEAPPTTETIPKKAGRPAKG